MPTGWDLDRANRYLKFVLALGQQMEKKRNNYRRAVCEAALTCDNPREPELD